MALGHTSRIVAAYSSSTDKLARAFGPRTKGSWLRTIQLLAANPVVSCAFLIDVTKLEMAAGSYLWLDCDPFLQLAGLLL
jgi:hypothetical protein